MAESTTPPAAGLSRETEEEGFYHEAALNAAWTASRLAIGGLCFLFGSYMFAYFYLRAVNSSGRWMGAGYHAPSMIYGTVIMLAVLVSAAIHYAALQQIKAGDKRLWQLGLLQRVHRLLPGVRRGAAVGHDLAGDAARPGPLHPGYLLRGAAAHLQ